MLNPFLLAGLVFAAIGLVQEAGVEVKPKALPSPEKPKPAAAKPAVVTPAAPKKKKKVEPIITPPSDG